MNNKIPGLILIPTALTIEEQANLVSAIQKESWNLELARRTQHYGYRYDYRAKNLSIKDKLGPFPPWLSSLCQKLKLQLTFDAEQVIINEYTPGQQITPHIDAPHLFGPVVASLSLCSKADMIFSNQKNGGTKIPVPLDPGSLVILTGDSRSRWLHSIAPVKEYRLSVTFRTVKISSF